MELASLLPDVPPRIRIHASHSFAISKLSDFLAREPKAGLDVRYMTNQASLESLRAQECELAAIHLPQESFESAPPPIASDGWTQAFIACSASSPVRWD
ncbi:DNA-binding transcriptional LysR family regulator [Aminobacter lissarensis]|uniref:DNA-binding transcriptional LysR family regulator n=1 Tax=Aminobacter carboxidus TaxID=376165 RepID=A0A8E2BES1_9HYPH|nr:hypothetical protein [Aminobacter lissarensis]MBB6469373.1 DNA-binding transcriptional LysR family regulator [Aminobacter lissarensis]